MSGAIEASVSSYQILRELGRGGMAEVFLARRVLAHDQSPFAENFVALKRLKPELASDAVMRQMLVEEARLGAGFNHPNLVEAYDLGEHAGHYFFTMELVRGHELRHLVRAAAKAEGRLALPHVLTIVGSIASGLNYAHDLRTADGRVLNVVHLDVCPSNVLVTPDGFVKLIDFGIARHDLSPEHKHESNSGMHPVPSDASVRRGTMAYMSPEQCLRRPIDRRSDVFSLGIILWELTVWRRLYRAPSRQEVFAKIVEHDAPRPTSLVPSYPRELEAIVMQALARNPNERFANARALLVALEEFAYGQGLVTSTTRLGKLVKEVMPDAVPMSTVPVPPMGGNTVPAPPQQTERTQVAPPNVTAPMPVVSRRPVMPAGPVPPTTTAPYSTVPDGSGQDVATELARRFQPISRRWRS